MLTIKYSSLFFMALCLSSCIGFAPSKESCPPQKDPQDKPWYRPKDTVGGVYDRKNTEIKAPLPPWKF